MGTEMKIHFTDDEEDLDALRLAALSSLKKKNEGNGSTQNQHFTNENNYNYNKGPFRGGKRRFFPGQTGRNGRNGQFNNVARNSNLISIPTTTNENEESQPVQKSTKFVKKEDEIPKLVRPQDRYASNAEQEVENDGPSSKFDRYDNSDSESEEDDEISTSKLERCDSLEALMEELDAEIQGEPRKEKKEKKVKKESKLVEISNENKISISDNRSKEPDSSSSNSEVIVHTKNNLNENVTNSCSTSTDTPTTEANNKTENSKPVDLNIIKQQIQRSPSQRQTQNRRINKRIFNNPEHPFATPMSNPIIIPNSTPFMTQLQPPQFTTVYNTVPPFTGPELFPISVPPPTFVPPPGLPPHLMPVDVPPSGFNVPPLRPLVIEPPGPISSIPMGPLSPRSAAFVLQNRAIVEKRKRSPRRSYSRSPSPPPHRLRYSKSPPLRRSHSPFRRSLSPIRRSLSPLRRSLSPRRSPIRRSLSPYRRLREKSPRRESPRRSPRRTRDSPKRSPKRSRESPKRSRDIRRTPVKDRLGTKNKNEEKDAKKKEDPVPAPPKKEEAKPLDPILEARKKKFENREINVKERVIRLKPKEEMVTDARDEEISTKKVQEKKENIKPKEEPVQRFKQEEIVERPVMKEDTTERIVLLPKREEEFAPKQSPPRDQLEEAMNELEMLLKDEEALELTAKVDDLFTDEETDQENEGRFKVKQGTTSKEKPNAIPFRKLGEAASKKTSDKKRETKTKWNFDETKKESKPKKSKKEPLTNPIENRKIEIKITNPAKYEKKNVQVQSSVQVSSVRRVEVARNEELSDCEESEPEIVVENEDDEDIKAVTAVKEGDLRAQLSRKRAERQNKIPPVEGVQPRLLQSALEGAVFKKKKSKKKDKEPKDVKLPIHLRLGIAHDSDIYTEAATEKISRKKSKKRKHAAVEQV